MRRRDFITLLGGAALWAPALRAQPQRVYQVGFITLQSAEIAQANLKSLRDNLRKLGLVETQNLQIDYWYAAGREDRLAAMAEEIVRRNLDLVVAHAAPPVRAIQRAGGRMPVVFVAEADPVGAGVVASLASPGGNVTGLSDLHTDLIPKRLQLLKEMVPGVTRIAVLHEQNFAPGDIEVKQLEAAAAVLNLEVHATGVAPPQPSALDAVLPDLTKDSPGALFVGSSGWFEDVYQHTLGVASKIHLPALYVRAEYVDAGGLMSYGVNYPDMYRSTVDYPGKILKGAKPADLPVWQPEKVELVINRRTAKALNLILPLSLVGFAERIIE